MKKLFVREGDLWHNRYALIWKLFFKLAGLAELAAVLQQLHLVWHWIPLFTRLFLWYAFSLITELLFLEILELFLGREKTGDSRRQSIISCPDDMEKAAG